MSVSDSHNKAMDFAERAFMAQIRGHIEDSIKFFEKALENELVAISKLESEGRIEPTYSVLHRSAGTLALDCNQPQKAREIVTKALSQNPHPEIAEELRELQYQISLLLPDHNTSTTLPHSGWGDEEVYRDSDSSTPIRLFREVA